MPATEAPLDDLDLDFHRVAIIPILNRVGTNRLQLPSIRLRLLRAGQLSHVLAHICCLRLIDLEQTSHIRHPEAVLASSSSERFARTLTQTFRPGSVVAGALVNPSYPRFFCFTERLI